jgi:hypothetical protein
LKLTVSSLSAALTADMPMLLLAIPDNGWTPATASWNSLSGELFCFSGELLLLSSQTILL